MYSPGRARLYTSGEAGFSLKYRSTLFGYYYDILYCELSSHSVTGQYSIQIDGSTHFRSKIS